jgi:uncharacterized protein YjbJ (UPF0337 family)
MTTTSDTTQKAKATASATADESRHLGHVAGEEAGNVAGEALTQARNLADEAKGQLTEQSRTQRDRLVGTMRTFSDDLQQMASSESAPSGFAADLMRQAAERTRQLVERIDGREPSDMLEDVRGFARRRPGTFLLGALAAGIVAGRVARGAKDGSSSSSTTGTYQQTGPAYDTTQAGSAFDEPGITTGTTTVVGSTAPLPTTSGTVGVEGSGQGTYGDPATGSL